MPWFATSDASIRYASDADGDGCPVVLLHEMGTCLETWDGVVQRLRGRHPLIRADMRGAGLSQRLIAPPTIHLLVEDVHALLRHLGITDRILLVGGAVGGAVALAFAATHPARVLGVIACSPAVGVAPDARAKVAEIAERIEQDGVGPMVAGGMAAGWPEALRTDAAAYATFLACHRANDGRSYANLYRMIADFDLSTILGSIDVPVLLVGGRYDRTRPAVVVEALARTIPGARYEEADIGHFASMQAPDWMAERIVQEAANLAAAEGR